MLAGGGGAMYGQQSLMPLIKAVTWGFGGGQLMAMRASACAEATDAAVLTPPAAAPAARRDRSAR